MGSGFRKTKAVTIGCPAAGAGFLGFLGHFFPTLPHQKSLELRAGSPLGGPAVYADSLPQRTVENKHMGHPSKHLDDVFRRHYHDLVDWCRRRVHQHLGDPEDFVHMAYLRCSRHWSAERNSNVNEAAYLYRALRWVIIDASRSWQRQRTRKWLPLRRESGLPWIALHKLVAQEAVMSLKGRQLQVCLALLAGKGHAQIRRELNLTSGALSVYLCRAKASLCKFLEVSARHPGARMRAGHRPGPKPELSKNRTRPIVGCPYPADGMPSPSSPAVTPFSAA